MASKFQNRLIGTIVLVTMTVVVIPLLLDGQKKCYQDDFVAIPLIPKFSDHVEPPDILLAKLYEGTRGGEVCTGDTASELFNSYCCLVTNVTRDFCHVLHHSP